MKRYTIEKFSEVEAVDCPCGQSRRAFVGDADGTATMHMVEVSVDTKVHYHKKLTEIYFVLEGEGEIELDGERFPLEPKMCVMIKPGCRHRAVGKLTLVNVAIPAFDPEDEWFD